MAIKLPEYVPPSRPAKRPTASAVNRVQTSEQKLTVAGYNEVVPIVYGRSEVSGPMIAGPVSRNGWAYYGVAISHGPIDGYENIKVGSDNYTASGLTQHLLGDKYEYHLEFYDGTQTTASPLLQEGIQFFGDVFEGVAYVAVKARGENLNLNNGATFTVRGKKIVDPRDNILKFTENPGLHLYDMVTNSYYGLNRVLIGAKKIADHCDSSFGGAPLSRVGHAIQTSTSEGALIDMLCLYAEAIWGYDGDAIYVVPDSAVPENKIIDLPARFIRSGSVRTFTDSAVDIPNSVTVNFNSDDEDGLAGAPAFSTKEQTTASTPFMNSSLNLMAVYRRSEAQRRADQRLARLQIAGRVSFQMFDTGGELKVGDVLRFPDYYGLGGVLLRVMAQPDMLSPGIYQIHCELYDASIYVETEVGAVVLPKGAVVPLFGDGAIPTGFSVVDVGDGAYIKGSELSNAIEKIVDSVSINVNDVVETESGGEHDADLHAMSFGSSDNYAAKKLDGLHTHRFDLKINTSDVLKSRTTSSRFVVAGQDMAPPRSVGFLHASELKTSSYFYQKSAGGYAFAINSGYVSLSPGALNKKFRTNYSGNHNHSSRGSSRRPMRDNDLFPDKIVENAWYGDNGSHVHDVTVSVDLKLESIHLNLHAMLVSGASIPVGGVVGYVGDRIPDGWALCDGLNGTLDLREKFIGYTGDEGLSKIGNEVTISANESDPAGRHSHNYRVTASSVTHPGRAANKNHDPDAGIHTHDINYSEIIPFVPRHIKLAFIQYTGENNE